MNVIAPTIFTIVYANICLLAFGILYERWMHRESFYQANRAYLLITPLLALLIPHLQFVVNLTTQVNPAIVMLEQGQQLPAELLQFLLPKSAVWSVSLGSILLAFYLLGLLICLRRSGLAYLRIWNWVNKGKIKAMGWWNLVEHDQVPEAASFFSFVFWNKKEPVPDMVLQHELVHVQQGHSWDVLLMEVWVALFWFNPMIYRLRQRLQETHEFIADAGVIEAQGSKYAYACLLASQKQKLEQMPYNTFAAQLNTRLRRMTQAGSPQWKAVKYALCFPMVMSLLLFFSVNYLQALPSPVGATTLGESIKAIENTPVLQLSPVPQEQNIKTTKKEIKQAVDTVPPTTSNVQINSNSSGVKIVTNGQTFSVGQNNLVSTNGGSPLVIIDGKNMGKASNDDSSPFSKLDPNTIKSINVLKGESAIAKFGAEAADGVVEVFTKNYEGAPNEINGSNQIIIEDKVGTGVNNNENIQIRVNPTIGSGSNVNVDASNNQKIRIRSNNPDGSPLIIKDGKVLGRLNKGESGEPLKSIEPKTIKSMTVIKGKAATDKYGKDAEDGAIEIETKQQ